MMEKVTKSQIKLVKSLQLKKNRDELGLFVAEGAKCVEELRKSFELVHLYREGENASRIDGIQDPGNLGTIIRTCDWFGVHDIVCSKDTADCYNPKVVQATMGALCRVRIHYVDLPEWLTKQECPIIGTLLEGENMYKVLSTFDSKRSTIIVMGNEGNGISQEVRKLITHPVRIPSYPNEKASDVIESLNVSIATAIVLAEFRR